MDILKKDIDRGPRARRARHQEFLGLKALPYLSKEQYGRFQWLKKQRVIDNKVAFSESSN